MIYGLDLFSGIGGITKALEGYITPSAYCENDRYCQAVLLSRMAKGDLPAAPIWDDVSTLKAENLESDISIVYGGFPCQDISVAGRRAGLGGKRSGLFFQMLRIIGEVNPRFVFLENVPNIRTAGADIVAAELARLRYGCRWGMLSAFDVGANHLRERWWLLAHAECPERWPKTQRGNEPNGNYARWEKEASTIRKCGKDVADADGDGRRERGAGPTLWQRRFDAFGGGETMAYSKGVGGRPGLCREGSRQERQSINRRWWKFEPDMGRVAHGIPFRVDRLRGLGNSVVPAQAREAFERLMGL